MPFATYRGRNFAIIDQITSIGTGRLIEVNRTGNSDLIAG
jgi:hypothetical protein